MAEPGGAQRLTGIEAGRGVAATAVVLYHAARHLDKAYGMPALMGVFQFGHAGVDLFFVISGFIILFVHYDDIGRSERIGRYLGRRFTRLMPAYWVALALTIGLSLGGGHAMPPLFNVAWSASLLPSHGEPLLGIAWTLQYEIVFYAVFGLLILNRMAGLTAFSLWLSWVVLTNLAGLNGGGLPASLYGMYNLEFFLGMAVAYWLKHRVVQAPRLILAAGTALFAVAALAEDARLIDGYADGSRLIYGSAAALIVLGAAAACRGGTIAVPKILGILGTASYSIYLFQFVFIGVAWKLLLATGLDAKMPPIAIFPVLAVAGVAGGIAMSRFVEYPLMKLARRSRRPAFAVAGAGPAE